MEFLRSRTTYVTCGVFRYERVIIIVFIVGWWFPFLFIQYTRRPNTRERRALALKTNSFCDASAESRARVVYHVGVVSFLAVAPSLRTTIVWEQYRNERVKRQWKTSVVSGVRGKRFILGYSANVWRQKNADGYCRCPPVRLYGRAFRKVFGTDWPFFFNFPRCTTFVADSCPSADVDAYASSFDENVSKVRWYCVFLFVIHMCVRFVENDFCRMTSWFSVDELPIVCVTTIYIYVRLYMRLQTTKTPTRRVRVQKAMAFIYRRVFFFFWENVFGDSNKSLFCSSKRFVSKTKKSTTTEPDNDLQPEWICMRIFMFVFVMYCVRCTSRKTIKRWWIVVVRRAVESESNKRDRPYESDDNGQKRRRRYTYELLLSLPASPSPTPLHARNPSRRRASCRAGVSTFYHHSRAVSGSPTRKCLFSFFNTSPETAYKTTPALDVFCN